MASVSVRYQWTILLTLGTSLLIIFSYPVFAGIIYFSYPVPSHANSLAVIRLNLLVLFIGGIVAFLVNRVAFLSDANISDATRRTFLASNTSSLIPLGFILSVIFASSSRSSQSTQNSPGGIQIAFSPLLLIILVGFFLMTILVPFFIGERSNIRWQEELKKRRKDHLTNLISVLRIPMPKRYIEALQEVDADVYEGLQKSIEDDQAFAWGVWFDGQSNDLSLKSRDSSRSERGEDLPAPTPAVIRSDQATDLAEIASVAIPDALKEWARMRRW